MRFTYSSPNLFQHVIAFECKTSHPVTRNIFHHIVRPEILQYLCIEAYCCRRTWRRSKRKGTVLSKKIPLTLLDGKEKYADGPELSIYVGNSLWRSLTKTWLWDTGKFLTSSLSKIPISCEVLLHRLMVSTWLSNLQKWIWTRPQTKW